MTAMAQDFITLLTIIHSLKIMNGFFLEFSMQYFQTTLGAAENSEKESIEKGDSWILPFLWSDAISLLLMCSILPTQSLLCMLS